jgi:structural maintenance of chromosome 2
VVVQDEATGSLLLQKGQLRKRVTIIPLTKIQASVAQAQRVDAAKKLAPGKVELAIKLIGYEDQVEKAMQHIFGHTLICADQNAAKTVTYDRNVSMRSVTYEGEVFDTSGTISGGAAPASSGPLIALQELHHIKQQLHQLRQELAKLVQEESSNKKARQEYQQAQQALELARHQVTLLQGQVGQSDHSQLTKHVQVAEQQIATLETTIAQATQSRKDALDRIKTIERDMNDLSNNREGKLAEISTSLEKAKAEFAKKSSSFKAKQRDMQASELEMEQLQKDVQTSQEAVVQGAKSVEQALQEEADMRSKAQELQAQVDRLDQQLGSERAMLSAFDDEIKDIMQLLKRKAQEETDAKMQLTNSKHELERFHAELDKAHKDVRHLEKEYVWIVDNKDKFGQPGTQYDFSKIEVTSSKQKLAQLEHKFDTLRKNTNMKVLNTLDATEKRETQLKTMVTTVLKDKRKIQETIVELDKYKREALEKTWTSVNKEFGEIFGELLDGNTCRLAPIEGKDWSEGLEVKVCLGGVWKQSLTELSGGQRSLVALALILSLLRFKPAPFYILDEIDAALDLSHTQNIGRLFKTRFKGAQFIVVSLKDGMFNNANVLFRTRFRDGVSVVERTEQQRPASHKKPVGRTR